MSPASPIGREGGQQACAAPIGSQTFLCDHTGLLFWPEESLLVVSDLHLEKGSSFARRGSLLPPYDTQATLAALGARLDRWRPRRVVSLGDSFHDDGGPQRLDPGSHRMLAGLMSGRDWMWISGNHDPSPPAGLGGESATELAVGPIVFRHEPRKGRSEGEIAGHLHPQARIVRRGSAVRRPCFATDGSRMIMPSFGVYTGGLNVRDAAFRGLFDEAGFHAHLLGRDRIYTIGGRLLV